MGAGLSTLAERASSDTGLHPGRASDAPSALSEGPDLDCRLTLSINTQLCYVFGAWEEPPGKSRINSPPFIVGDEQDQEWSALTPVTPYEGRKAKRSTPVPNWQASKGFSGLYSAQEF